MLVGRNEHQNARHSLKRSCFVYDKLWTLLSTRIDQNFEYKCRELFSNVSLTTNKKIRPELRRLALLSDAIDYVIPGEERNNTNI
jgi:hypothetical protein